MRSSENVFFFCEKIVNKKINVEMHTDYHRVEEVL